MIAMAMDNRSSYRGCSLMATLLICFSVQTVLVISQECMYQYVEQPGVNINCNPYGGPAILRLQCALTTTVLGSNVSINWYHSGTTPLMQGLEPSMETNNLDGIDTFRSILTLTGVHPQNNSGDYHCQAEVDGANLQPSGIFTLTGDENEIINLMVLRDCRVVETDKFVVSSTKCADVSPTVSVTTPTTPPPQPSQTTLPTTTTPSLSTTSHAPGIATTNSPGSTEEGTISTAQNNGSTEVTVPETLQVWIYVLVGVAAVFGIIIVILAIMCVGLCVRRSKTQDSSLSLKHTAGGTIGAQSMVSNDLYHSSDNFAAPSQPPPPNYQPYSTIGDREYETIGIFGIAQTDYAHLHRPSPPSPPPPLPSTLPNGRLATINGTPPTPNTFISSPPSLPPKGNIPSTHVYGELEDPLSYTPPHSANVFERSTDQLLPSNGNGLFSQANGNGPFSQANGGPYRKFSLESATASMNESLYSPTTPTLSGLTDIPETGMSFMEPNDPSAFPVHEYEVIPPSRKTKKYESPVPDERHMIPDGGHVIGGKPQTRVSVKSCNYETDPKMDLVSESDTTGTNVVNPYDSASRINPYDSTTHIRTTPPLKNNSDYSDLRPPTVASNTMPPTRTNNSNYSKLNLTETESNYSRLQSNGTDNKLDSDFFKGASEICLSSTNPRNSANGGSVSYDSDHGSRETTPPHRRGCSVPLSPPPYPQQGSYSQLTLPPQASRYPPHLGSKTLVQ